MSKKKLMIIGMGYVSRSPKLSSKQQICDYLTGLDQYFDITWVCEEMTEVAYNHDVPNTIKTIISRAKFRDLNLTDKIADLHPDAVLISFNALMRLPIRALLSLIMSGTNIIMYVGTDYLFDWRAGLKYNLKTCVKRLKVKAIIPFLSAIICRGSKLADDYKNRYCKTYKTIPIISKPLLKKIRPLQSKYILFIGNLNRSKGYTALINAFISSGLQAELTLVCIGPKSNSVDRPQNDKIIELGRISDASTIYNYLHYAELLIVPSLKYSGEGVPRVIQEAILAKTPRILSTPLPGILAEHRRQISFTSTYEITANEIRTVIQSQPQRHEIEWQDPSLQHAEIIRMHIE